MKTHPNHLAVVQQVTNNTTSWIGHRPSNDQNEVTGQTFMVPKEGDLEAIEVFSSIVTKPGKVIMKLHHFDPQQKSWGPALSSSSVDLNNTESGKWLSFHMKGAHLDKGKSYGFRLESPDTYVGVGEAAGSYSKPPFGAGQEWKFSDHNSHGQSYSYFSLAFKVELRA